MKVIRKGKKFLEEIRCSNDDCEALLNIEDTDLTFRWTGQDWGGDSRERTIGVICPECGHFISMKFEIWEGSKAWEQAEINVEKERIADLAAKNKKKA